MNGDIFSGKARRYLLPQRGASILFFVYSSARMYFPCISPPRTVYLCIRSCLLERPLVAELFPTLMYTMAAPRLHREPLCTVLCQYEPEVCREGVLSFHELPTEAAVTPGHPPIALAPLLCDVLFPLPVGWTTCRPFIGSVVLRAVGADGGKGQHQRVQGRGGALQGRPQVQQRHALQMNLRSTSLCRLDCVESALVW